MQELTNEKKSFKAFLLAHNEEVPKEFLNENGTSFFLRGNDVWKLENNAIHSVLHRFKEGDEAAKFRNRLGDPAYLDNYVYRVRDSLFETHFPIEEFQWVMKYFQIIYDRHKTEAGVWLLFNNDLKTWKVLPVLQLDCSPGGVNYMSPTGEESGQRALEYKKAVDEDEKATALQNRVREKYDALYQQGWRIYGTIHSHCEMSAFHSGVDDADEKDFDGLHITIGKVRSGFHYAARIMAKTAPFPIEIEKLLKVENMSSLNDLDHIEVSEDDLDLMMPDLGKRRVQQVYHQRTHNWHGKAERIQPPDWEHSEHDYLWRTRDTAACHEEPDKSEWHGNVFDEDQMVALRSLETGKVMFVRFPFYLSNFEQFSKKYYTRVMFETKKPKTSPGTKEILLINDGDLDPDQPATGQVKVLRANRLKKKKAQKINKKWGRS